jgi:hypothetical protein
MTTCKGDCNNYGDCISKFYNYNKQDLREFGDSKVVHLICKHFSQKSVRTQTTCESCNKNEEQWVLDGALEYQNGKDKPYHVCSNCLMELTTYSLKPEHFKNLIKNGHSTSEFLLHGDFYDDESGEALQPCR